MSILSHRRCYLVEVWVDEDGAPVGRHHVFHESEEQARQIATWMFIDNCPEFDTDEIHTSIMDIRDLLS